MSRIGLRWRLAGAFTVVSAAVLIIVGVFLHYRLAAQLDGSMRAGLRQRAGDLVALADRPGRGLGSRRLVEPGDDLSQILDARRAVLDGAPGFEHVPLLAPGELARAAGGAVVFTRRRVGDEAQPAILLAAPARDRVVVVGSSLEERDDALGQLDGLLLLGLPAALMISALAGLLVAGRGLAPIDRMRTQAEAISTDDLGRRLPEPAADDELRRLSRTLNAMLARLDAGFARERTFVADAGHELRTPLASLSAELELALRPGRGAAELRAAVVSAAAETAHLTRLAEDLLIVARADAGRLAIHHEPVELDSLFASVRARAGVPAHLGPGCGLRVAVDPQRLGQALGNLLDNAVRHGAPPYELSAVEREGRVRFEVHDRGAGMPPELDGRAFDRFTRGDLARESTGAGLGLAIVAAVAAAHDGSAGHDRLADGTTVAWLELPCSGASQVARD